MTVTGFGGFPSAPRRRGEDRLTVDALRFYVPIFHRGDRALEQLAGGDLDPGMHNALETQAVLRELAVNRIAVLAGPLITREINKLIRNSHLNNREEDLFDILYYAGINGMVKGLRHFDVGKLDKSSTNYLFQWIVTYAKKELSVLEAPFGVAPSRFQRYKKISAVRKRLSEELGRYAENQEVLDFFHSGRADLKTMSGRLNKGNGPYASNRNMTLELVREQEHFEQNLSRVNLLDPLEDYQAEVTLSEGPSVPLAETSFGMFLSQWNFTQEAQAVLLSELHHAGIPPELANLASSMTPSEYRGLLARWRDLLRDPSGPFHQFLTSDLGSQTTEFDRNATLHHMGSHGNPIKVERYLPLFKDGKMERL